jgi:hypothetical protein
LRPTGEKRQPALSLPALERAQARWTEVIHALEMRKASHQAQE